MKKQSNVGILNSLALLIRTEKVKIVCLVVLCVFAYFLRSYAIYRDLIFAYDQGRDAWEMQKIAAGDLTLIGPVTGLEGVFLGPFWYYLIFPAYYLGNWNPVAPAYEMFAFAVGTVILLYLWGRKLSMPTAGLIAAGIFTFSFQQVLFARWVSNPSPLPFFSLLAFYLLYTALLSKKNWIFVVSGFVFGLCFQLEAANAVWFLPTIALIVFTHILVNAKKTKTLGDRLRERQIYLSTLILGLLIASGFILAEAPHILFELKHNFLITRNAITDLQVTRDVTLLQTLPIRVPRLFMLYGKGIFEKGYLAFVGVAVITLSTYLLLRRRLFRLLGVRILALWFVVPLLFHILFTGNHGNFWDYYIIAQHPVLYLLLGVSMVGLYRVYKEKRALVLVYCCVVLFVSIGLNLAKWTEIIKPYKDRYSLDMMVQETNWIIDQAAGEKYGVWVYNPSAQDDSHRYIYWWVGTKRNVFPEDHVEQQPLIFLAVEDDPIFWLRHDEWIKEKLAFGKLVAQQKFGAITVYKLENTTLLKNTAKSVR